MNVNDTFICSKGLIIPTYVEIRWSISFRAFLYLVALLYFFLGIAIIADVFMCAIERITCSTRKIKVKKTSVKGEEKIEYKEELIWNPTVANLSLMALGSSAPEILLSVIEIIAGDLGPGTIVGSAAFNLMVVNAACILALPNGETKKVSHRGVFCLTSAWNVFAYIWLLVILLGTSKDEIRVWEGAMTFGFFFALVFSAYIVDRRLYKNICFPFKRRNIVAEETEVPVQQMPPPVCDIQIIVTDTSENTPDDVYPDGYHSEWREIERRATVEYPDLPDEELAKVVALKIHADKPKDYLEHRIEAVRKLSRSSLKESSDRSTQIGKISKEPHKVVKIEFASRVFGVNPDVDSNIKLKVVRKGPCFQAVQCRFETVDGVATKDTHFKFQSETVEFQAFQVEKFISIEIINPDKWTDKNFFSVKLDLDQQQTSHERVKIGNCSAAEVVCIRNDTNYQSSLNFVDLAKHCVSVKYQEGYVRLPIVRNGNIKNQNTVGWITEEANVDRPLSKCGSTGTVAFEENEIETYFDIPIGTEEGTVEKNKTFAVRLINPSDNCCIGQMNMTIVNYDGLVRVFRKLDSLVPKILQKLEPAKQSWEERFVMYLNVNGGDTSSATMGDYLGHIVSFPWKILCAFVPPPIYLGGWLSFVFALAILGIQVAFVIDIASTFGCLVGLDNTVTAITFVALGSSMPDLFASRFAAKQDRSADNAVGNVTGSNSMNVFVGLGVPWFIASIYWAAQGKVFRVPSGDLGFSVCIYTIFATITIVLLLVRRRFAIFGKAELGGPTLIKWICSLFLIMLWFLYILLSALQVHGNIYVHF